MKEWILLSDTNRATNLGPRLILKMGMQGEVSAMQDAPAFAEALLPCEVPDDPVLRSFLVSIQVHLAFLSNKNQPSTMLRIEERRTRKWNIAR